jgi:hypothetical protein
MQQTARPRSNTTQNAYSPGTPRLLYEIPTVISPHSESIGEQQSVVSTQLAPLPNVLSNPGSQQVRESTFVYGNTR